MGVGHFRASFQPPLLLLCQPWLNRPWAPSIIDLIDIAVPNALHAPIAIAATQAGKMVLCEKPLATSLEEAARMAEAVREVPNMVWFNYRRVPAVSFSRQLIEEGRIGKVFHYRAHYLQQWGTDPKRPPGWKTEKSLAGSGVLGDLLSHLIDTALWLNGPIVEVSALLHTFAAHRDVDDALRTQAVLDAVARSASSRTWQPVSSAGKTSAADDAGTQQNRF